MTNIPTKHTVTCTGSASNTYDEFHFTLEDLISFVQMAIADEYGVAVPRVKVNTSIRYDDAVCFSVDLLNEGRKP